MGMKKDGATVEVLLAADIAKGVGQNDEPKQAKSGAAAALERLSAVDNATKRKETSNPTYKARDYEAEAIGKTRCVQFEAALMSPAIAGMRFDTMTEYLKLVREAAEAGVAFSFEK